MRASKKWLSTVIAGLLAWGSAQAGIPVTEGNTPQKSCGAQRGHSLRTSGQVIPGNAAMTVKERRLNVGRPLNPGDVVFYVAMTEGKKVYTAEKQIEIIDSSPFTPDAAITPQDEIDVIGTFMAGNGRKYDLISLGGGANQFFALVADTGYLCSDRLNKGLVPVGLPTVYQEHPLKMAVIEPKLAKPRTVSVAISFVGVMGVTATFDVAVMVNGITEQRKTASFDVLAPNIQIGSMGLTLKNEDGKVVVTSLDEPADYTAWLMKLRAAHMSRF